MRFIIYGAGAVGGVAGARLFQAGHEVVLIARGAHLAAIRKDGLGLQDVNGLVRLPIPAVGDPSEIAFREGDVVLLCMKSQDTAGAVEALRAAAGDLPAVVCVQNGVESERLCLRRFSKVYAAPVRMPASHLEPGVVIADSYPVSGILDIGRYPAGVDATAEAISAALAGATFSSNPIPNVMAHKYTKLWLVNLTNAVEAICGSGQGSRAIAHAARDEAEACYKAAGIAYISAAEDRARRGELLTMNPLTGNFRPGGSTWQSLQRGKRDVEADYLNGEIVLLGRLHGVPTPVNEGLMRVANDCAARGLGPGSMT
ncbi:MAG: ketopantoate reductase family protein, partial [Dehalococcoidia bacterium]